MNVRSFLSPEILRYDQRMMSLLLCDCLKIKRWSIFFCVHIDRQENSHIQFISSGSGISTVVDLKSILTGINKFNSKKVFLIHNHPSGNLMPSKEDFRLAVNVCKCLNPLKIAVESMIINTFSREYSLFKPDNTYVTHKRVDFPVSQALKSFTVNEQDIIDSPIVSLNTSKNIFCFLQQLRFSAFPKSAMLELDNRCNVTGNYILQNGFRYADIVQKLSISGSVGRGVVFYGNQKDSNELKNIKKLAVLLKRIGVVVLDYLVCPSDHKVIKEFYESMADEGLLYEHQEKYKTGNAQILEKKNLVRLNSPRVRKKQFKIS